MQTIRPLFFLFAVGCFAWLAALLLGAHIACAAYNRSPDIVDFGQFAMPTTRMHQSKFVFLFSPSIGVFVIGLLMFCVRSSWFAKQTRFNLSTLRSLPIRILVAAIGGFLLLFVTIDRAQRALTATSTLGGSSGISDSVTHSVCKLL